MTMTTSRRAILAGAAAIPALTLPAIAAEQTSFPDLAAEFEETYREWLKQLTADRKETVAYRAAFEKISGRTWKEYEAVDFGKISEAERDAWNAMHHRAADSIKSREYDWTELNDDIYSLCDEILQQEPRSLTDLKIQVRAFALRESHLWLDAIGDDIEPESVKRLVEVFCKHLGLDDALPGADHLVGEA